MSTSAKSSFAASTIDCSIQPDASGLLTLGPGEPLLLMEQLCKADPDRKVRRDSLFAFYHLTDSHHSDTATGRSLEVARQFDPGDGELGRAYRMWAPFSSATLISAVGTLARCNTSQLSGRPVDLLVLGGDFINNSQVNELSSFASIFRGQVARPFKHSFTLQGTRFNSEPEALSQARASDTFAQLMCSSDDPVSKSLYQAASTPMLGARLPYPAAFVLGNHDLKALGHMAHSWLTSLWALQPFKVLAKRPASLAAEIKRLSKALYSKDAHVRSAACKDVVKLAWRQRKNVALAWSGLDFGRRAVSVKKAWQALHPLMAGMPVDRGGAAYYTIRPVAGVVLVMLDTTARGGSGDGQVTDEQFNWLKQELARAEAKQELAIVVSHHPSYLMVDRTPDPGSSGPVHLARDVVKLLLGSKAVVAHVAGHTHRNRILQRRDPMNPNRAYWELTTCSMVEWPQQFRFLELFRNGDGTLSLVTCMMNHLAAPAVHKVGVVASAGVLPEETALSLASYARTLSYRDGLLGGASISGRGALGRVQDRNVELLLRDPYG